MPANIPSDVRSLSGLNTFIRRVFALNFPEAVWVRAELASVRESRGHLFLELIENDEAGNLLAQSTAAIWQPVRRRLRRQRGKSAEDILQPGAEVQLQVEVDFHIQYGHKLIVADLDPEYTLGTLEQKRQQTLAALQREGLLERNRQLPFPPVLQRLAVISSPQAAGLADFKHQLRHNPAGYRFAVRLFPAGVQGHRAAAEIREQLTRIGRQSKDFDAAILIRGGGARTDLLIFDDEDLCRSAADLPIPLLTGIGHETDQTILDLVAAASLKTPTAVAEFLLQRNEQFEQQLLETGAHLTAQSRLRLQTAERGLRHLSEQLHVQGRIRQERNAHTLRETLLRLRLAVGQRKSDEQQRLQHIGELVHLLGPEAAMDRGYVKLETDDGNVIYRKQDAKPGMSIRIQLQDGRLRGRIDQTEDL